MYKQSQNAKNHTLYILGCVTLMMIMCKWNLNSLLTTLTIIKGILNKWTGNWFLAIGSKKGVGQRDEEAIDPYFYSDQGTEICLLKITFLCNWFAIGYLMSPRMHF